MIWDVIIVGAGPAGSACAGFCAQAGLKTIVLERAEFPREKVCGDCLNPSCWPVLDRLGASEEVLELPHSKLGMVEISTISGKTFRYATKPKGRGQIAVPRSGLDMVLARRAAALGAEVRFGAVINGVDKVSGPESKVKNLWQVRTGADTYLGKNLVAADGRNSATGRFVGSVPPIARERVALQTHIPAPPGFGEKVSLHLLPEGYYGMASVGNGKVNLCMVGRQKDLAGLRAFAKEQFQIPEGTEWRSVAPLSRPEGVPLVLRHENPKANGLVMIGDAARVVEPFTGEGTYYAMATGELAAKYFMKEISEAGFLKAYKNLYARRLWINRLAKLAVLYPKTASKIIDAMSPLPLALRILTAQVVGPGKIVW